MMTDPAPLSRLEVLERVALAAQDLLDALAFAEEAQRKPEYQTRMEMWAEVYGRGKSAEEGLRRSLGALRTP